MIFQHTSELVMKGRITQTRRIIRSERIPGKVGATIAVQPGRGMNAIGRVVVTDVYPDLLGHITENDARAEGFAGLEEFVEKWEEIHGWFTPDLEVWVIKFRLRE